MTGDPPGFDPVDASTWHPMNGRVVDALRGAAPMLGVRLGTFLAPAAEHIARRLFPLAERTAGTPEWLRCPNTPPCPHPGLLHDIEDLEDPRPTCCAEGCSCGRGA